MSKWRPGGWENVYDSHPPTFANLTVNEERQFAYEAGADAILDALFKMAEESPTKTFTIDARTYQIFGE